MPENTYERGAPQSELERLKRWGYPNTVSAALIDGLRPRIRERQGAFSVLDIGAGPNPALGDYVKKIGGGYAAFDVDERFIASQRAAGHVAVRGNIREGLVFDADEKKDRMPNRAFDMTHTRFVLMHLDPEARKRAVQEILRVTDSAALFLDWHWDDIKGPPVVEEFKNLGAFLMREIGSEPSMGNAKNRSVLAAIAKREGFSLRMFKEKRPRGNYYQELIDLNGDIHIPMLERELERTPQKDAERSARIEAALEIARNLQARLIEESEKEHPTPFYGASISIVIARRR